jgi:hypothetical protein
MSLYKNGRTFGRGTYIAGKDVLIFFVVVLIFFVVVLSSENFCGLLGLLLDPARCSRPLLA